MVACISSSPSGSTLNKNGMHFDRRIPVQPSIGVCDMAPGRQAMVSTDFMNLPTSAAFSGPQYVQYMHPQMITTHRGAAPYPSYSHLPSRGNVAPAMSIQQQMQQYMCSPGYAPHPGVPASQAGMKIQQFQPTPQQQQQQMWQFHFSQYQPRQAAEGAAAAAWQNGRTTAPLRPMQALHAPPSMPPPPQMELLCAPYQGGGGARRPPQLRLI